MISNYFQQPQAVYLQALNRNYLRPSEQVPLLDALNKEAYVRNNEADFINKVASYQNNEY